jgi:hypothetical protein
MTNAWNHRKLFLISCGVVAFACATQVDGPLETDEVNVPEGAGGSTGGTPAMGGTLGSMPASGGTGGSAVGGTGASGGSVGGTESSAVGGTGNAAGGTGGSSLGKAGAPAMNSGGRSAAGGRMGSAGANPGSSATAMGCAKLSVPMNGAMDKAHFVISLRSAADLSAAGTTISMHLHVEDGTGGVILAYVQDSSFNFLGPATKPLLAEQSGWVTLDWDVGAEPAAGTGIQKKNISRVGIEIKAAPSSTWSNPTVVYIDSITVNKPALSFPFGTMSTVSATAQSSDVSGQVLWQNSGSMDTTATGTKLSWVADCP